VTFAGCTKIEPGYAGIVVNEWGGDRGVQEYVVRTGKVWYNPFTQTVIDWPIQVQRSVWTKSAKEGSEDNEEIKFNDENGLGISADIAYAFEWRKSRLPYYYVKFRDKTVTEFMDEYARDRVREYISNIASTYSVEDLLRLKGQVAMEALDSINHHFAHMEYEETDDNGITTLDTIDIGVHFTALGFIGELRPPDKVIQMIEDKISATQLALKAENEVQTKKALAEQMVVTARGKADAQIEKARGEAEAQIERKRGEAEGNRLLAASITSNLVTWRRIDVQHATIEKWAGQVPQFVNGGDGNGGGIIFQLLQPSTP